MNRAFRRNLTALARLAAATCQGVLLGCDPGPGPADPDDTGECALAIDETWPLDGSADFYVRDEIAFYLDAPASQRDPVLALWQQDVAIAGESRVSEDRETVTFTPAAPLDPRTPYTATLSSCLGESSIGFTTSNLGILLEAEVVGRTYLVDLLDGRVVTPEGFGDIVVVIVEEPRFLVEVQEADETLVLLGAATDGHKLQQAPCAPTIPFPPADFSQAPYFEVSPVLVQLEVDGVTLSLHEFELSGTFAPDGTWFGGGVIGGELDTRDLVDLVPDMESPEDLCALVASFGAACEPCTSDGELLCLPVLIDRLEGFEVPVDVVEITDPSENPDCQ